jgi:hypothetical protein
MAGAGNRWLRILFVGAIATLSFTFYAFGGVAHACDPDVEDCEPVDEEPPDTSPPHTSPPATSPPHTSPPATHPPATCPPATHAPAVGKTATTVRHTQTTRHTSSGNSSTPEAPAEPFLEVPVAPTTPVDPGVQLPAVQLAGDAKAVPGVGTAAEAGLPPETSTRGGGGDPKLALALAAAGVALLGAPLIGKKCDETASAAVRSQIANAGWEISSGNRDLAAANARHASITAAIAEHQLRAAAVQQAHAGIDAIRATRNWRWWGKRTAQVTLGATAGAVGGASVLTGEAAMAAGLSATRQAALAGARYALLAGTGGYFAMPGADPIHSIDSLPEEMGAADFEAALAKAHADLDAQLGPPGVLESLQASLEAATADITAAGNRVAAAQFALQDAKAQWNAACGPTPGCAA